MSRFINKLMVGVATLGFLSSTVSDASACGGIGLGLGFGGGSRAIVVTRPARHIPVVVVQGQPGYQYAPGYDPSVQGYVPSNMAPSGTTYANGGVPVNQTQAYPQTYTSNGVQVNGNSNVVSQGNNNYVNQTNYQGQSQNMGQQAAPNGQPVPSLGQNQTNVTGSTQNQMSVSGQQRQMPQGGNQQGQFQGQMQQGQIQQGGSQQLRANSNVAPMNGGHANGQPVSNGQMAAAKPVSNQAPINNTGSANNAQMAALQALMATDEQPAATAAPAAGMPVGDWTAKVSDKASVHLTLQANGAFRWSAENSGKSSAFEGTYTVQNGALTLTRSTDSQKLEGTITMSQDGFTFRLKDAKDAGLTFSRS